MRKLQHQNSCNLTQEPPTQDERLIVTQLGNEKATKTVEGKIMMLEERGKSIQMFYENKIAQLKAVLARQNETKCELTQELMKLTLDSQRQAQHVARLKAQLNEERLNISLKLAKEAPPSLPREALPENQSVRKGSRGKGGLLFSSNNLRELTRSKPLLKKCRSQQFIQSQYFGSGSQGSATHLQNPEHRYHF